MEKSIGLIDAEQICGKAVLDMWEAPIKMMQSEWETQLEGEVLKATRKVGVVVDKEELLKALEYDREQYEKGYGDAVKECLSVIREVYHNFCGYDLEHMTKYGNETAEQQHDSYSSLMMYEIAGEFDDLIDQIEGGYRVVPRDEAAKLINKLNDKVKKRIEEMREEELL